MSFHVPERHRVFMPAPYAEGLAQPPATNGAFLIPSPERGWALLCVSSDGYGWEHVSVHALRRDNHDNKRAPGWGEMCHVKDQFWDETDTVVQYHPRASDYVNAHPYTLHLWRPVKRELPTPPPMLVGPITRDAFK